MKLLFIILCISLPLFSDEFINYKVQKGDTLSKICKTQLEDPKKWRELLEYNSIKSPNLILPGTNLKLPGSLTKKLVEVKFETIAKISDKEGILKLKKIQNDEWLEIEKDKELIEEDLLRTAEKSKAEVIFVSKPISTIILDELTIMKIKKDQLRTIELKLGGANIKSVLTDNESPNLRVKTSSSVCDIKGEEAEIFTNEKKANYASYKGKLDVSAQNQTVSVPQGYGTYVITGQPPLKPFKILDKVTIKPIIKK